MNTVTDFDVRSAHAGPRLCQNASVGTSPTPMINALERDQIPSGFWRLWPGGWRDEIGTALVDAVYSARATYKTKNEHGIFEQVSNWRARHDKPELDSVNVLIEEIRAAGPKAWAAGFGNSQHSPRRSNRRPDSPWKSSAILEAAELLRVEGIECASDVHAGNKRDIELLLRQVPGIGEATSTYFMMLLGLPGVKADVMIRRYVGRALDLDRISTAEAVQAVEAAASTMNVNVLDLEHTIWEFERTRS